MTGRSIAHARRRIGVGQGGGSTRPDGTWRVLVLLGAMLPVAALAIERPQRPAPGTDARAAKTADVEVGAAEAPHFRIGPGPFDGLARGAETLVAAPDGRHLVVWPADLDRDALLVDTANARFVGTLPHSGARKVLAVYQPDGQRLHVVHFDSHRHGSGVLTTWDMRGPPRPVLSVPLIGDTSELAISPDGRWLAPNTGKPRYQGMLDAGGIVEVRFAATLDVAFATEERPRVERRQLLGLQFGADGTLWVAESWDQLSGVESSRRRVHKAHRITVPGWKTDTFDRPPDPALPLWILRDGRMLVRPEAPSAGQFAALDPDRGTLAPQPAPAPSGYLDHPVRSPSGRLMALLTSGLRSPQQVQVIDVTTPAKPRLLLLRECTNLRMMRFVSSELCRPRRPDGMCRARPQAKPG